MTIVRSPRSFLLLALLLAVPMRAQAQAPSVPPFVIQSDNGDNRIQIGALLQVDGRFTVDDPNVNVVDTFLARRIRVPLQGRVARIFEFYFNPDFANSAVNVRDAYFETRLAAAVRVRAGKGKAPFGLERLQGAAGLLFVERALPTTVAPDRDMGIQVLGDLFGNVVSYAGAIGNGVADGSAGDLDTNEGKDLSGRVVVRPFGVRPTARLSGLNLAFAASVGEQPLALPGFRSAAQQTFFTYVTGANPAQGVGDRVRYSPQFFLYAGPLGTFGEYVRSTGDIQRTVTGVTVREEVTHTAWQVAFSWVVTGEAATERGVRPKANFDPGGSGGWGALQLAVRYNELRVGENAVSLGFAAPGASRVAQAWGAGANWYLNPFVKWVFNVERTVFDEHADGPRTPENALVFRAQLAF